VPVSDLSAYHDLISRKRVAFEPRGLDRWRDLPAGLFPHQAHGVEFALRAGCSALFYDTGLGKTAMSLTWGERIVEQEVERDTQAALFDHAAGIEAAAE
jgi:hypothetical protein